ncbi:hypothetical protein ACHAQH_005936 [Verticillium albo-atrum]
MSFLIETITRRTAALPITRAATIAAPRTFTTTPFASKSATETVKDGLKTVDRAVSDKLVDGINAGSNAAQKVKATTDDVTSKSAAELRGEAVGKAEELKGQAKGAAHEAAGKAQGTAEQVKKNL